MKRTMLTLTFAALAGCGATDGLKGDEPKDELQGEDYGLVPYDRQLTYLVVYDENDRTLSYSAGRGDNAEANFKADGIPMTLDFAWGPTPVYQLVREDVAPEAELSTKIIYESDGKGVESVLDIPQTSIVTMPTMISRAAGFEIELAGEPVMPGDFVDVEIFDPATNEQVAMFSARPSIPSMKDSIEALGNRVLVRPSFLQAYPEFEPGKSYLLGVNRSPRGWNQLRVSDHLVNYQVTYKAVRRMVEIAP